MTESLVGRTVRITGGECAPTWLAEPDFIIAEGPGSDGTVRVETDFGSIWIAIDSPTYTVLIGEVLPEGPPSLIGRRVRLTGEGWDGKYGMPERNTVHVITHDRGFERFMPNLPGINPDGDDAHRYYVVLDVDDAGPSDYRDWSAELLPAHPEEPPVGSVITYPFGDIEGDVAERASDGGWLIVGESGLSTWDDIVGMTDAAGPAIKILRHGYDDGED